MTRTYAAVLAAVCLIAPAHGAAQPPERPVAAGEIMSFHSSILGEARELQVVLPESYDRTTIPYPVLFLLDGSSHVLHATATVRFLAAARNRIPEMIIVAIPNANRNRDMTPGPGAATFQRVIAEEVIPWVEHRYRAAPERILAGHSLSASFAVHTLLNRPELFDAYIAASAPLWRYDGLADDMRRGLPRAATAGAALYLTVGEHENTRLREGVLQFASVLRGAPAGRAPAWSFVDMPDEDHSSTSQRTLYSALESRYVPYRFPFFEELPELERLGGTGALERHYQRFSTAFGYTALPPESRLLQVARLYLGADRHADTIRLAEAYAASHPALAERLVDQVGDARCRAGDATAARRSFQRAADLAAARSAASSRLARYQEKARRGCPPP